jgi:hypothetical protein
VIRSAVDKVMWVGRGTVFLVGLVVILALMFAFVNAMMGASGGPSLSGKFNQVDPVTRWAAGGAGDQALAVEPVARRRQVEIPRGYAQVNVTAATVTVSGAKGINGVQRSSNPDKSEYCFDLTFVPKVAVASAHFNNNATVGTILGTGVPSTCPTGFKDAAAKTYAANTGVPNSEVNFRIIFI